MATASGVDSPDSSMNHYVRVALDVPLTGPFDYASPEPLVPGLRVIVPFGRRRLIGVVIAVNVTPAIDLTLVKSIQRVLRDLPALPEKWLAMAEFASSYYQRPSGEVILPALPAALRRISSYEGKRSGEGPVARQTVRAARAAKSTPALTDTALTTADELTELNSEQALAVQAISAAEGFSPFLLHGVTGSGKTRVYLAAARSVLARGGRVLFLVPEINLTPQFAQMLQESLGQVVEETAVAVLHSGLADSLRLDAWRRAIDGTARIVLGTRLAVFAPLPDLSLIVVDEEHDPSYKQQEGLRYSARDLAVWRARQENATVVLGSATPSLETWLQAQRDHYRLLTLAKRAAASALPTVRLVDTRRLALQKGLAPQFIEAMVQTLEKRQQVLVFLNRRGYSPVLHCDSCGWVSHCDDCSAFSVLHRHDGHRMRLHCHHCGSQRAVPAACPACGDQDLQPMGRGTQRLEETLESLFPEARIARIDADSTRLKGSAQVLFGSVHAGEVDILIGTQMVSKGHDFANLGLVGVLNADSMLFSQDFRAPERLFAQLMQVAGRAGRDGRGSEVLVQTAYPEQPVYQALKAHDFAGFAASLLEQRQAAGLPPYAYQALLTAQATELSDAIGFLSAARTTGQAWLTGHALDDSVCLYDPVPLRVVKVARVCRAQLLIEAQSRHALHRLLRGWLPALGTRHATGQLRWQVEVDPLEI